MADIMVTCPHCNEPVAIAALNCCIFRHGVLTNGQPIAPHASRQVCEALLASGQVLYGCAGPFRVVRAAAAAPDAGEPQPEYTAVACDYI